MCLSKSWEDSDARPLHVVQKRIAALLESKLSDRGRTGDDGAALPADIFPRAGIPCTSLPGSELHRLPDSRLDDDVATAECLCQQLVQPDSVQGNGQYCIFAADPAVLLGIFYRFSCRSNCAWLGDRLERVSCSAVLCRPSL